MAFWQGYLFWGCSLQISTVNLGAHPSSTYLRSIHPVIVGSWNLLTFVFYICSVKNFKVYYLWNITTIIFQDFIVTNIGTPLRAVYRLWFIFVGNETSKETRCKVKSRVKFIRYITLIVDHWFVPAMEPYHYTFLLSQKPCWPIWFGFLFCKLELFLDNT